MALDLPLCVKRSRVLWCPHFAFCRVNTVPPKPSSLSMLTLKVPVTAIDALPHFETG